MIKLKLSESLPIHTLSYFIEGLRITIKFHFPKFFSQTLRLASLSQRPFSELAGITST